MLKVQKSVANLRCIATISAINVLGALTSDDALAVARALLWQRYIENSPCFFNLELVSKEGLRTRFVYVLSRDLTGKLALGWSQSQEIVPGPDQQASWSPTQEVAGTTITRHETDGRLEFMKEGRPVGSL
jgi:hypothetical protein